MTHRHPAVLTLAFILITSPLLMTADDGTTMSDRDACLKTLKISPELAELGTYKWRVDQCVHQRELLRLNIDRNLRNTMRFQSVQQRVTRNSRATVFKSILKMTPEQMEKDFSRLYSPEKNELTVKPFDRPSRRSINTGRNNNSKATRSETGDLYQARLLKALDACKLLTNDYDHSNCVRNKMVEQGQK